MRRGVLCMVVAVAAVSLSAAAKPNAVADEQQRTASNAVGYTEQNITATNDEQAERAHRAKYEAQCNPGDDKRDSDLCAQWKAADAAADSAWWAATATWVGGISGVLVLIALGLAFEANRIARDTAKRQLRAYVSIHDATVKQRPEIGKKFEVRVQYMNSGETPALHVQTTINMTAVEKGQVPDFKDVGTEDDRPSVTALGKGGANWLMIGSQGSTPEPAYNMIMSGEVVIFIYGRVEYRDVFNDNHLTTFRVFYEAHTNGLRFSGEGNEQT